MPGAGDRGAALAGGLAVLAAVALVMAAWKAGAAAGDDPAAGLLLAAAEGNPQPRLISAGDGAILFANAAFRRLFAPAAGEDGEGASLKAVSRRLGEADEASEGLARLAANAAAGIIDSAEMPLNPAADPAGWFRVSVSPVPGLTGHALWRFEDVTARREMEIARHREETVMADYLDRLPVGFFSADAEGRILFANQTIAEWLGISVEDIGAGSVRFADFVVARDDPGGPGEPGEAAGNGAAVETAGESHGEVVLVGGDGEVFRAYLAQSQLSADDGTFVYSRSVVMRDFDFLVAPPGGDLEQRLRWLFDEAPVCIVLLDLGGNVTECNRAFLRLLGRHGEAVVGRPLADRIAKEDRADVAAQLSKVVMGTIRAVHLEVRLPGSGSRELVASLYASRVEDATGEVTGLILHFIDTTEQKHLEIQFVQAQKMQAVGQLAGGVAHDFNNLLTAMIGFCDLLLERHDMADPSFSDIMQIKQNANRATNLVRQLLAFSRKQTLKPVLLDITEVLADMSSLLHRLIGETIEIKIEHGRDLGPVRADRGQLDQVVVNLVVNARDAMPGGGVISIRTSAVSIEEQVERGAELMMPGRYVLIEVADTGVGISKENIGRIFEPFFSTKEAGSGTGLGLSTVYGIVRQTDGYIFVDSAPGEGTTFSLYLPRFMETGDRETDAESAVVFPGAPAAAAPPPVAPPPVVEDRPAVDVDLTGKGTVLLVEDEEAVRMFGARALRNKGYHVLEADNGESALDAINNSSRPIDLIISDVVMPGMDGHTLVRLVRQELPEVRVILISGYAEDMVPGEIGQDPTLNFLPKPFSLKQLASKVKEVLGN